MIASIVNLRHLRKNWWTVGGKSKFCGAATHFMQLHKSSTVSVTCEQWMNLYGELPVARNFGTSNLKRTSRYLVVRISLGMNILMFFVMFNMFEVRFYAKMWCSEVFGVQSCCYMTRLVLELNNLMFVNFSVFCDVWHVRSSILGQNVMFRKFDVRTFNVRSVQISVFWCSFQD